MSNQTSLFTYVNDQDIQSFLENKSYYAYKLSFLGTTGKIVAHNEIYGVDNEASYVVAKSLAYLNNELSELAYDFNESSYVVSKSIGYLGKELNELAYDFDESSYVVSKSIGYLGNEIKDIYEGINDSSYVVALSICNLQENLSELAYDFDESSYVVSKSIGYLGKELNELAYDFDESSYVVSKSISNLAYSIDESSYVINKSIINLNERVSYLENNQSGGSGISGDLDLSDYVTKSELEAQSYLQSVPDNYVTKSELEAQSYLQSVPDNYVTKSELEAQSYAGYSYVYAAYTYVLNVIYDNELIVASALTDIDDRLNNLDIDIDLSAYVTKSELEAQSYLQSVPDNYVTKSELEAQSYLQSVPDNYVTKSELEAQSYAGYSYVYDAYSYILNAIYDNEYVTAYAFNQLNDKLLNVNEYIDFSPYVPKTWMNTYAKNATLNTYVKKSDLNTIGYLRSEDLGDYATQSYAVSNFTSYAYIEQRLSDLDIDMSAYVKKSDLNTIGYLRSQDLEDYATKSYAVSNFTSYAYIEQRLSNVDVDLSSYVSKSELVNESYATSTYVETAYAHVLQRLSILEVSSGGNGSSGEGGIAGIVFNGQAATITNNVAVIDNYTYDATITLQMNNATVDTFTVNAHTNKTIDFGSVVVPNDLSNYVSKTELSNAGYITSGLPSVSASDNGKILMVVNGAWAMVSPSTIYSGNATPSNANGNNGDIYLQS